MQIEARNISFRYRENTPWILKDVSLKIEEGERGRPGRPQRIRKKHAGKNSGRLFEANKRGGASGRKASAEKRSQSGSAYLPASGKSDQSQVEDEKSFAGVRYVPG